jgi:hypothetical protein
LTDHEKPSIQFRYYMIRVQTPADTIPTDGAPELSGVVERLGSGEKRDFADVAELVRLVTTWSKAIPNMGGGSPCGQCLS